MRDELIKIALTACLGIIVTGATAWLVFGQDKITRGEMVEFVNKQTPWVLERGQIQGAISRNTQTATELGKQVTALVQAQHQLVVEQRVLVTKFDAYLDARGDK